MGGGGGGGGGAQSTQETSSAPKRPTAIARLLRHDILWQSLWHQHISNGGCIASDTIETGAKRPLLFRPRELANRQWFDCLTDAPSTLMSHSKAKIGLGTHICSGGEQVRDWGIDRQR